MAFINPGDVVFQTVPGYPVMATHTRYLGGEVIDIPLLEEKYWNNLNTCFDKDKSKLIYDLCLDQEKLEKTKVHEFMELFAK